MRIDAYTQVQQLYSSTTARKMQNDSRVTFKDQLQISNAGKDIQAAKQAVAGTADIREDVVSSLKAAVNAGTYQVSPDDFAARLFEKYNSANLGSF